MPKRLTTEEFIIKANKVHNNKFDYNKVQYTTSNMPVCIICPTHNEFWQQAHSHLQGKGCPRCSGRYKPSLKEFIIKSNQIHNNFYNYSKTNYINSRTKIIIICKTHGSFLQTPHKHLSGRGCPKCCRSKGEIKIEQWLQKFNIEFIPQKHFKKCRNKRQLSFDFFLPKTNTCIEYDGEQHFIPFRLKDKKKALLKFQSTKKHDKIKNQFCKNNHINLIRISFQENISYILSNLLSVEV